MREEVEKAITTLMGVRAFGFGFTLLLPVETFSTRSYTAMAEAAPEWVWGIGALVLGAALISWRWLPARYGFAVLIAATLGHGYVSLTFWVAGTTSTGVPAYGIDALACALMFLDSVATRQARRAPKEPKRANPTG